MSLTVVLKSQTKSNIQSKQKKETTKEKQRCLNWGSKGQRALTTKRDERRKKERASEQAHKIKQY